MANPLSLPHSEARDRRSVNEPRSRKAEAKRSQTQQRVIDQVPRDRNRARDAKRRAALTPGYFPSGRGPDSWLKRLTFASRINLAVDNPRLARNQPLLEPKPRRLVHPSVLISRSQPPFQRNGRAHTCDITSMGIHMRKALLLAAGLALIGTSAWSQSSSQDRDNYPRGRWHDGYGRWDRDGDRDRDDRRERAMRDDEDDDRSGRGARFLLRRGDTQLRVVCGEEESTRACVDAASTLFDRVQSQARAATGSPAPSSPAPTTPPSLQ
jgi:hypothetical protein